MMFSMFKALFTILLLRIPDDCKLFIMLVCISFNLFVKILVQIL